MVRRARDQVERRILHVSIEAQAEKIRAMKNLCIGLSAVQELASPDTVTVTAVSR